jgi:ribosome recycling factor
MTSDLGLNPSDDGNVIRIEVPPPTEEGRQDLAKRAEKEAEEGRIAIRNVRREAIEGIKAMEKREGLSEDEVRVGEKDVQRITAEFIEKVDRLAEHKRKEIMEV